MFNIPPEPYLTGRSGPAHTLFPVSGTQKLEHVLLQMPTVGICSLLQNSEVIVRYGNAPIERQTKSNFLHL